MTAKTAAPAILNPCLCSQFAVITREWTEANGQPETSEETTGCTAVTAREFAAGHDAKLKSLLIRAGIAGLAVRQGEITSDASKAASQFAFGYMVDQGIARGREKAAAKADKKAARAAAPKRAPRAKSATPAPAASSTERVVATVAETPAPAEVAPATVEIRVGRWAYQATIDAAGDAHYTTAKGAAAVAVKGTYKQA